MIMYYGSPMVNLWGPFSYDIPKDERPAGLKRVLFNTTDCYYELLTPEGWEPLWQGRFIITTLAGRWVTTWRDAIRVRRELAFPWSFKPQKLLTCTPRCDVSYMVDRPTSNVFRNFDWWTNFMLGFNSRKDT